MHVQGLCLSDKMPAGLHFLKQACLGHCFRACLVQAKVDVRFVLLYISCIPPLETKRHEISASKDEVSGTSQALFINKAK